MEPPIQYCVTDDGVSIAYWELGDGFPLVLMPALPFSHLQMEWEIPEWRDYYLRLATQFRIIRYDTRGIGLSDHSVLPETFDSHLADLEAVVEHLGFERFALLAVGHAGPVAIEYASAFPQRVSHLVLWCSYAKSNVPADDVDWEQRLLRANYPLYALTTSFNCAGWGRTEAAQALAALFRESVSQQAMLAISSVFRDVDASPALDKISAPTLIMTRRSVAMAGLSTARLLAQSVPGARLSVVEGDSIAPFFGSTEPFHRALEDFVPRRPPVPMLQEPADPAGLRTIFFSDLEGHTAMMQNLGDAAGRDVLREHERIMRRALLKHGGAEVKALGDGFLASFNSAQRGLECAITLQQEIAASAHLGRHGLRVRIGVNAGEPIAEDDDLFGNAVIATARIAAQAAGGQILASNVVRELVAGKGFLFSDRGNHDLRGFEDPVHLWEVRWEPAPG